MLPTSTAPSPPPRRPRKVNTVYSLQMLDDGSFQLFQYFRPPSVAPTAAPSTSQPATVSSTPSTSTQAPHLPMLYQHPIYIVMPRPPPRNIYTAAPTREERARRKRRAQKPRPEDQSPKKAPRENPTPMKTRQSARVKEKTAATTQAPVAEPLPAKPNPPKRQTRKQSGGGAFKVAGPELAVEGSTPKITSLDASPEPVQPPARRTRQNPTVKPAHRPSDRRVRVTASHAEPGVEETIPMDVVDVEMVDVEAPKKRTTQGGHHAGKSAKPSEQLSRSESTETVSTASGASPPTVSTPATTPSNDLPPVPNTRSPRLTLEVKQELVNTIADTKTPSPVSLISPVEIGASQKRKSDEEDTTDQDGVNQPVRSRSGRIVKKRKME